MKKIFLRATMALTMLIFTGSMLNAQTFVVETTSRITIPADKTEEDMEKIVTEMFSNIHAKSEILLGYSIRRHAWGSEGATVVVSWEVATWEDIEKFVSEEMEELSKTAWPDEAEREAKWDEYNSYLDRYHKDEIYTSFNDLRGYATPAAADKE